MEYQALTPTPLSGSNESNSNSNSSKHSPQQRQPHACMSFTAPQFSMQDERRERENLSEQEREALRQDYHGYTALCRETPTMWDACLEKFYEYVQRHDEIPADQKQAYQQALQQAPDVVANESDPMVFLRAEEYDPEAAAWRMMHYWRLRKDIFGPDVFWQPMQQLAQEEEEEQQQRQEEERSTHEVVYQEGGYPYGSYVQLPKDCFGRPVLFFAEGQGPRNANRTLRQTFLLFHKLVHQQEINQRHGCVIIVDARSIDPDHFNRKQYRRKLQVLREAVPMRIRVIHVCFAAFKSPARLLQPSILWMYGRKLRLRRKVHYGSRKVLAQSLLEYGLKVEGLPPSLGGTLYHDGSDRTTDQVTTSA